MVSNGRKIQQQILALLARKDYQPLDKNGLANALGRKSGVRMGLNQALRELERAGEIARVRKNRYVLPAEADLVTGKVIDSSSRLRFSHFRKTGRAGYFHRRGKYWHSHAR
jgi:exoribonuclease R